MPKHRALLFLTGIAALLLIIVGCGADNYARKAEEFYAIGEYYDAAEEFKKAY